MVTSRKVGQGRVGGLDLVEADGGQVGQQGLEWTVPASVDTRLSCPIRRESEKWVRHAAHIRRSTRRSR